MQGILRKPVLFRLMNELFKYHSDFLIKKMKKLNFASSNETPSGSTPTHLLLRVFMFY